MLCFPRLLGDIGGVSLILRLTRSRQHTQKLVFASSKVCCDCVIAKVVLFRIVLRVSYVAVCCPVA